MSTHASPGKARRRTDIWFAVGVLLAVFILGWVVVTMQQMGHDLRTANETRDALAQQVERLGSPRWPARPAAAASPGPPSSVHPGHRATKALLARSVPLALWARVAAPERTGRTALLASAHQAPRGPRVRTGNLS